MNPLQGNLPIVGAAESSVADLQSAPSQHTRALLRATNANEQRAQQMFVFPQDRIHKIETGIQQQACLSVRRS